MDTRPGARELALAARTVLVEKCGECHRPEADNKKAKRHLADVSDLSLVVEESVAPGDLELSDLWLSIEDESMPPEDATAGPLTLAERELLRAWILQGSPVAASGPPSALLPPPRESFSTLRRTAGRLHPSLLHFPIAFLLAAALLELLSALSKHAHGLQLGARYMVRLAVLSAPLVAFTGWLFAAESSASDALEWHKRAGIALAITMLPLWLLCERAADRPKRGLYRCFLFLCCLLVGVTGHLGGELVYGADFLPF